MRANGVDIAADCGGRGRCGKCVCFVDGERRLACETIVNSDIEVTLPDADGKYDILMDSDIATLPRSDDADSDGLAVAVDIGTTTLVVKLVDIASGREVWALAALNSQRPYGADVISRINVSMDDASVLSGLITNQIDGMIETMLRDSTTDAGSVRRIVIAGNTTMSYLLLGLPCRSLGLAPFKPAFTFKDMYAYDEVFHSDTLDAPVYIMPFVSAYVGGDVTSGLLSRESLAQDSDTSDDGDATSGLLSRESLARDAGISADGDATSGIVMRESLARNSDISYSGEPYILVDMGTNGEIAYRRGDRLLCTSTAAGPAFEGGNISCGSGSVEGAISKVWIRDGAIGYETIGNAPARSICGSGLLDAMACFVREGIINSSGAMNAASPYVTDGRVIIAASADSPYVTDGRVVIAASPEPDAEDISLTQRDVREFQLAKSAVRSGIETLIGEVEDLVPDKLYLAGGFGQRLDADSAFITGLLPESVRGRVIPVGNSSIAGATLAVSDMDMLETAHRIAALGEEINLAAHPKFNTLFMEYMTF
jgi:uncharacterized 2Fe-2S/4Fe-4S cluster protein (DUF4445 family)